MRSTCLNIGNYFFKFATKRLTPIPRPRGVGGIGALRTFLTRRERCGVRMEQAQLRLHPDKTKVVDATQRGGFDSMQFNLFSVRQLR